MHPFFIFQMIHPFNDSIRSNNVFLSQSLIDRDFVLCLFNREHKLSYLISIYGNRHLKVFICLEKLYKSPQTLNIKSKSPQTLNLSNSKLLCKHFVFLCFTT